MNGILCLESSGFRVSEKTTVRPVLESLFSCAGVPFIFKTPPAAENWLDRIERWVVSRHFADFPILYLSAHGEPGDVVLGSECISLEEIFEVIAGRGEGKAIHISACLTLALGRGRIEKILSDSNLSYLSGYHTEVDWIPSMAFEMLLLKALSDRYRGDQEYPELKKSMSLVSSFAPGIGFTYAIRT